MIHLRSENGLTHCGERQCDARLVGLKDGVPTFDHVGPGDGAPAVFACRFADGWLPWNRCCPACLNDLNLARWGSGLGPIQLQRRERGSLGPALDLDAAHDYWAKFLDSCGYSKDPCPCCVGVVRANGWCETCKAFPEQNPCSRCGESLPHDTHRWTCGQSHRAPTVPEIFFSHRPQS